jgi:ribosomal-protein-alanine N-acetyltransferase
MSNVMDFIWSNPCSTHCVNRQETVPKIETEYADLVELTAEHSKDIFDFASHERVAKTVVWEAHQTIIDSLKHIDQVRTRISTKPDEVFLCWGVREKKSSKIVGLVSLTQLGTIRAQIGYVFHFAHWDSKLPVDCLRVLTRYTFETFPEFERLQCRCFPTNQSSIHLLERVGFQYEGVNHSMVKIRDQVQDLTCYAMTRKHFSMLGEADFSRDELVGHI